MNPYRLEAEKQQACTDEPPAREDDSAIAWVWLGLGVILILTDVGEPGPWGTWSSLGMLLSGLAIVGLWRYYATKWKHARNRAAKQP